MNRGKRRSGRSPADWIGDRMRVFSRFGSASGSSRRRFPPARSSHPVSLEATMVARATHKRPTAIIVGAGIGGTASAARLSQAGFDVTGLSLPP